MTELSQSPNQTQSDLLSRPILAVVKLDWEKTAYLIIIILAIVTRFWGIGDRVVSHDESLHTQYSYQYYNGDGYQHTALMHGPSLFHATALSYWLFGDSDASSRIPVAILGIVLVILPYFLRDWLGRLGALVASILLLISPFITYYSRYIRHDIYVITFAVVVFIAILYYLRERKDKYVWWFATGMGLMFATMETSYIYVAIFGSFLVLRLAAKIISADWFATDLPTIRRPLLLLLGALLLLVIGFAGQRVAPAVLEEATPSATVTTEEGFAADPNEALTAPEDATAESALITIMRWVQIAGLILVALAIFLVTKGIRKRIDGYAEFDLVVLLTTLTLPLASAFLIAMAGGDPLDYTFSTCQLDGQEAMSTVQLFFARLSNATCRSAFLSSGIVISTLFVILTITVAVLIGLWWNRRRWLVAAAIFNGIFLLLFTSLFTNPSGWASGTVGSLGYWLAQQEVQRANQPLYFYFIILPLYEFLPFILTLVAAHYWARRHQLNKLVTYWLGIVIIALLAYSLVNWYSNRGLVSGAEVIRLPGQLVAGLVLAIGVAYWFLVRSRQLKAEYGLNGGWKGVISVDALFGFVPYLVWWFVLSWVIYSLAGEKMAWLSTHFIFPMVLMAGWYINEKMVTANLSEVLTLRFALLVALSAVFIVAVVLAFAPLILGRIELGGQEAQNLRGLGRFLGGVIVAAILYYFVRKAGEQLEIGTKRRAWLVSVVGLLGLLTIRFTYMANFPNADYTTEFLVYAHGAPATKSEVLAQLEELSMRLHGDKSIKVAFDNDSSWPYTWYLRDYPNRIYFGDNPGRNITEAPVIIVGSQNWGKVEPLIGDDYDSSTFTFLWWPMEEYRKISWNAIFGDPTVEPEFRRGLFNSNVRQALWNILFYRDYQKYGEVFGGVYTAGEWPLRHDLRMYIRKDTLANIWDHGIDAVAAEPAADPYAENDLLLSPEQVIGSGGSGQGELLQPRNIAVGPDGMIYVADSGNHRIQVFDQEGRYVRSWGEFGSEAGRLNEPWGLAVDDSYVYVADTWNHRLQKFTLDGEFVSVLGQSGSPAEGQDGGALFFGPRDILIMPDGNLLVTDTGNHRLQILDPNGSFVDSIGSQGSQLGQFYEPVGFDLSSDGELFVADTWNGRIQRFGADMVPSGDWLVDAWYGESINNKPYLATDDFGRVYVTDPEGYRVLVFDESGQYAGRFGQFSTGTDGFGLPNGIEVDVEGNIYVADAGNNRILKFAPLADMAASISNEGSAGEE